MRPLFLLLAVAPMLAMAQDITGRWVTIDDNTGKRRSVVEIGITNGKAHGRIVEILDTAKVN